MVRVFVAKIQKTLLRDNLSQDGIEHRWDWKTVVWTFFRIRKQYLDVDLSFFLKISLWRCILSPQKHFVDWIGLCVCLSATLLTLFAPPEWVLAVNSYFLVSAAPLVWHKLAVLIDPVKRCRTQMPRGYFDRSRVRERRGARVSSHLKHQQERRLMC